MKFIVSSTTLLKHLQNISGVINNNNTTVPIITNFLFQIEPDEITITATDLETTLYTKVPAKSEEKGKVAIPAKIILDTLKEFPEMPLSFLVDNTTFSVEISSGTGKFKLAGFNGDEFPTAPSLVDPNTLEVPSELLATGINMTIFATGADDMRPVMSGVFCQISKNDVTFAATDAHKLVRYRRNGIQSPVEASFILPKKALNILKNIASQNDETVKMAFDSSMINFKFSNFSLVSKLIEGKYPNYEAVIPKDNPNKLTVDRIPFLRAVKTTSIYSNKTTYQVRLKIAGSELNISAEDYDFNNAATERLSCEYKGEDMEIGFSSKFLLEMLSNLDTDQVCLELSQPNRAGILLPVNSENTNEEVLMLVMPVMLNS